MIANGVVVNGIAIPTEDMYRLVFFGDAKENLMMTFKVTPERRGLNATTAQPAGSTSVEVYSNGMLVYDATSFAEVTYEIVANDQGRLVEQITLYKQRVNMPM